MEDILKLLENISVKPSAIDEKGESAKPISTFMDDMNALCDFMEQTDQLGKHAADIEWELLQDTHIKLHYLEEYFSNEPEAPVKSLGVYLESIDSQTIRYLKDITWDNECFEEENIRHLLETSLNTYDPVEKLELMNEGYEKMVVILEEHNRYILMKEPTDRLFLELFPKKRKRELN
jgi:hypothetical protein